MKLSKEFLQDLNYLNIGEYQAFCDKHKIPNHIYIQADGGLKKLMKKTEKKLFLRVFVSSRLQVKLQSRRFLQNMLSILRS